MVERAVKYMNNYDMVIFGFEKVYPDHTEKFAPDSHYNKSIEYLLLHDGAVGGYLWNKIYKTKLIQENNMRFNTKQKSLEDLMFNISYCKFIKNIKWLNNELYFYRMRRSSIVHNSFTTHNLSVFSVWEQMLPLLVEDENKRYVKYLYILDYYRLKTVIQQQRVKINPTYLSQEKILKSEFCVTRHEQVYFFTIKHLLWLRKRLSKLKHTQIYE